MGQQVSTLYGMMSKAPYKRIGEVPDYIPEQIWGKNDIERLIEPGFFYIWPKQGRSYWVYVTYLTTEEVAGWVWSGRFWLFTGMERENIASMYQLQ